MCLKDYDFDQAQAGLKIFLTNDTAGFPPVVGQIIDCIHKMTDRKEDILTEMTAWGLVYKAVCNSGYNSVNEFNALPEIVKNAVGSPERLREWSQLPTDEVQTVIQSNFMRSFKATQIKLKEYRKMPKDIQTIVDKTLKSIENKGENEN